VRGVRQADPTQAEQPSDLLFLRVQEAKLGVRSGSQRDRRKQLDYNRRYLYGISIEEFEARLASQDGRCAICRTDTWNGKGPHIDHSHETGALRGILCHKCNLGLGKFNDDPDLLRAAIRYLEGVR
jgi:Autographiviridae endonuclease VII